MHTFPVHFSTVLLFGTHNGQLFQTTLLVVRLIFSAFYIHICICVLKFTFEENDGVVLLLLMVLTGKHKP